jgi:glutamyl-tRNA synthetase
MQQVRTRFAPSPTGFLHVGGVRTALFAWLVARQAKGQFFLRIEDTDKAREVAGSDKHIMESLSWLGLEWDGQPYRQSESLQTYRQWAKKLIDSGRAYADSRSSDELERIRRRAAEQKKPVLFRERRASSPPDWKEGMPLRFKAEPKAYSWQDEVLGELSTGPEVVDDFILIKSDGFPTYNFAHIIDDHLMKISHVIRSQEFLASVPNYLNLYEALGIERPLLATLPYVMSPNGQKKLSKRDGAKDILDYKKQGFLPEALINFLVTLGWNDGTKQEIFSQQELIDKFDLSQVHHGGARVDEERLMWMNGHYIRAMGLASLAEAAKDFWPDEASQADDSYKKAVLKLVQERLKYLAETPQLTSFFFVEPAQEQVLSLYNKPADKQLKNLTALQYIPWLKEVHRGLGQSDFSQTDLANRLNSLLKKLDLKPSVLFPIIRIGLTGSGVSPQLFGTLHVLGKEKSLKRLDEAVRALEKQT